MLGKDTHLLLDTLLYLYYTRDLSRAVFVTHQHRQPEVTRGIQKVNFNVREAIVQYLTGVVRPDQCPDLDLMVQPIKSHPVDLSGGDGGGEDKGEFYWICKEERVLVDLQSVLTNQQKFEKVVGELEYLQKLVENPKFLKKVGGVENKRKSADGVRSEGDGKKSKTVLLNPIILVPSHFDTNSLINVFNAKAFLDDGKWVSPEEMQKKFKGNVPKSVSIKRPSVKLPGKTYAKFEILSEVKNLKPEDWERVVAVFASGQTWQFKDYKPTSDPAVLLNKCTFLRIEHSFLTFIFFR
jgi:ribosomal protein L21E